MNKIKLLLLLAVIPVIAHAQETVKLLYINKVNLEKSDQEKLSQVHHYSADVTLARLFLLKGNEKTDSLNIEPEEIYQWKDSVSFFITVPAEFLKNTGDYYISPVYHISYRSPVHGRGALSIDATAASKKVSQIDLKIKSDPSGAQVYMIPKWLYQKNPIFKNFDPAKWMYYQVTTGPTTTHWKVQEYVYVAVYIYNNKMNLLECSPNHLQPVDSIYLKMK